MDYRYLDFRLSRFMDTWDLSLIIKRMLMPLIFAYFLYATLSFCVHFIKSFNKSKNKKYKSDADNVTRSKMLPVPNPFVAFVPTSLDEQFQSSSSYGGRLVLQRRRPDLREPQLSSPPSVSVSCCVEFIFVFGRSLMCV